MSLMEIRIEPPEDIEAEYRLAVVAFVAAQVRTATAFARDGDGLSRNSIINLITRLRQQATAWLADGVDGAGVVTISQRGAGNRAIRRAIEGTERNHRTRLREAVTAAGAPQATRVLTRDRFDAIIRSTITRNVSLIRDVTDQQQLLIEQALLQAWAQPELRGRPLIDRIADIQGRGQNRAALIANNEIGTLHSQLQIGRFRDLGVEEYVWRTSQDERVRRSPVSHVALNGRRFRIDEPTDAEDGLPPGGPIRCRCVAIPVFVVDDNG